MNRVSVAMFLNAVVPGAGLIVLRREWLGLVVSVLFAVFSLIFIFSRWITPADIPTWAAYSALVGLILVWAGSMAVVVLRARFVGDPELVAEIEQLRKQASTAIESGDFTEAKRELLVALSLDDENAETWMVWSELMKRQGNARAARAGWKRVIRLTNQSELQAAANAQLAN